MLAQRNLKFAVLAISLMVAAVLFAACVLERQTALTKARGVELKRSAI